MGEVRPGDRKESRLRRIIDNDYLTMAIRLTLGVTFIYASLYKIVEPAAFARSIWYYHLVPGQLINLMALIIPWIELLCGLCLILGYRYRGSVVLTGLITVVFVIVLSVTIARGIIIDCGCFKAAKTASGAAWQALWFDLVLISLVVQLLMSRSRRWMLLEP